ncbi:MAG: thiolase family protein, partial [Nitrospirae bacterium]|nr:thiolase family protein [Nitrospirota bacterium]
MGTSYIISGLRTPIGNFGKSLAGVPAPKLAGTVVRELIGRGPYEAGDIDQVILGNALQGGEGMNPARQAAVDGGIPYSVPAYTVNMVCASGLQAIVLGAQAVRSGEAKAVIAGGFESMSSAPRALLRTRWGNPLGHERLVDLMIADGLWDAFYDVHMAETVEHLVKKYGLSREDQDRVALGSHQKAVRAIEEGLFTDEIVPVQTSGGIVRRDEHPRGDTTLERLMALKPAFLPDGTITAGNASSINDGAAAVLISADVPVGSSASAEILQASTVATDPMEMGIAPAYAIRRILSDAHLDVKDIDLWEINEAFAGQMLAMLHEIAIPADRLNVNGGAIALGHPIGCSGARILVTLLHEMK